MANLQNLLTGDPLRDKMIQTLMVDSTEFVYDKIAPRMGVPKRNGAIGVIGRSDKIENTAFRADSVPAQDIEDLSISEQTYNCKSIDRRKFITNAELNHTKYNPDLIKMSYSQKLTQKLMRLREKQLADLITNTNKYASSNKVTLTGTDQFTHASSKPIDLLVTKANLLLKATGVKPDSIFIPWVSWNAIITNANVKAELSMARYQTITTADIMPLLKTGAFAGLQNIIIGDAVYDTATKTSTVSRDFLWSDDVIIFKKATPIDGAGLVDAGFLVSAESEDPEDFGSLEYRDENQKLKGLYIENRLSYDLLNCGETSATFDFAYLIHDTNA